MRFEEYARRWLDRQSRYAPSTLASYRRMLEVVFPYIGAIPFCRLRPISMENLLAELRKRTCPEISDGSVCRPQPRQKFFLQKLRWLLTGAFGMLCLPNGPQLDCGRVKRGQYNMASIRIRGNSYLIVVSMGYDHKGTPIKPRQKTVHPPGPAGHRPHSPLPGLLQAHGTASRTLPHLLCRAPRNRQHGNQKATLRVHR